MHNNDQQDSQTNKTIKKEEILNTEIFKIMLKCTDNTQRLGQITHWKYSVTYNS